MSYEGAITPASIRLPSAPTRTNYNFQGWTDVANSETSKWSAGTTISVLDKTKTIYAAWKQGYYCSTCKNYYQVKHYTCPNCTYHYTNETTYCVRSYTGSCGTKLAWGYDYIGTMTDQSVSWQCKYCSSWVSAAGKKIYWGGYAYCSSCSINYTNYNYEFCTSSCRNSFLRQLGNNGYCNRNVTKNCNRNTTCTSN